MTSSVGKYKTHSMLDAIMKHIIWTHTLYICILTLFTMHTVHTFYISQDKALNAIPIPSKMQNICGKVWCFGFKNIQIMCAFWLNIGFQYILRRLMEELKDGKEFHHFESGLR